LRSLPFLAAIEWGGLFAPFLFHMFYGLWIVYSGKTNVDRQKYARNWAYVAQRTSALVVFVFIFYHVISMKYLVIPEAKYPAGADFYAALREHFRNPYVYWWYVVGVSATVFHLANGLCTFCMTWGITVGRNSQRFTAAAMTALGLALLGLGIGSLNGFISARAPHGEAKAAQVAVAPQQK
jgi:succinate dehydrogenase / fumarate reductase cytochrome b subunit